MSKSREAARNERIASTSAPILPEWRHAMSRERDSCRRGVASGTVSPSMDEETRAYFEEMRREFAGLRGEFADSRRESDSRFQDLDAKIDRVRREEIGRAHV